MPTDYDLVILGGAIEGRTAAMTAAGYGARVALVEPPSLFERRQQQHYLLQGLQQLGNSKQQQAVSALFQSQPPPTDGLSDGQYFDWSALLEW
ncbi:MAG: hypothetical protein WBD47_09225, partial [Phormidesmis sp.]